MKGDTNSIHCQLVGHWMASLCIIYVLWKNFIYLRERERERESTSRQRGWGRVRSRPPTEQGDRFPWDLKDPDILTWAEVKRLTDWATQVPLVKIFNKVIRFTKNKKTSSLILFEILSLIVIGFIFLKER